MCTNSSFKFLLLLEIAGLLDLHKNHITAVLSETGDGKIDRKIYFRDYCHTSVYLVNAIQ